MRHLTHNNRAANQLNNFAPTQGGGVTPAGENVNAITQ
ncbi:phenylalanyl-tRNA synthetase subunit beta [Escherichia sp. E2586]|nr:phenylalanyl-tRNA synthetase subunit beta [Escherichia sp. E2586]